MEARISVRWLRVNTEQAGGESLRLTRIRTWHVPPGWSFRDRCDEARAHCEGAACVALSEFNAHRQVPLDYFLYRRVVDAVWTRHRQECSYGRRTRPGEAIPDRPVPEGSYSDPPLLRRVMATSPWGLPGLIVEMS